MKPFPSYPPSSSPPRSPLLVRHTAFNLIGLGVPLLFAFFTIPLLVHALGAAKFGILSLIWAAVSYFGLFDLGLGRTLTLQLSVLHKEGDADRFGRATCTALVLMAILGVVAGGIVGFTATVAPNMFLEAPDREETIFALGIMAWSLPVITITSGLRGVLEARHAFGMVNTIRLPLGVYTFVGPALVAVLLEPRLDWIATALVLGRWVACLAHAYCAWLVAPAVTGPFRFDWSEVGPLTSAGAWLTISNIISPLMGYADRFMVAGLVSTSAAAYYAAPYEIVTKLWIVPGALTAVLFPTFAALVAEKKELVFRQSVWLLGLALYPICAFLAIFAPEFLTLWISTEFATHAAALLRIFALGILVNSLAHVPYTLIQSAGRAKWTGLVHLAEVLPFLAALWWLTQTFGPLGAALAWLLRICADTIFMFAASSILLGRNAIRKSASRIAKLLVLIFATAAISVIESIQVRVLGFGFACVTVTIWLAREPAMLNAVWKLWKRR